MVETTQAERREGMLRKVRSLLAKADSTAFTAEADAFRQKADELMTMFAIEEFELVGADVGKREQIKQRRMDVCIIGHVIEQQLIDLSAAIARYCRVRHVYTNLRGYKGQTVYINLVGFESDLDYFEVLFTSLHMHMTGDLEPRYNGSETLGMNVLRMKESGMKWERIAQLCNAGAGSEVIPFPGPKAITVYKAECRRVGAAPMKTMPSVFVRNFAAGFVTEITHRLLEIRKVTETNVEAGGNSLVLFKDRDVQVAEEFHVAFPSIKHVPAKASGKFDGAARSAGKASGSTANLSRGGMNSPTRGSLGS